MVSFLLGLLQILKILPLQYRLCLYLLPKVSHYWTRIFYSSLSVWWLSCLFPEIIRYLLYLLSNQRTVSVVSFSKHINSSSRLVSHAWGVISSAKLQLSVFFKMKNRPFRNLLNKIGPRTDPSGRPLGNADHKLKLDLIFVLFQRLLR